MKKKFTTSSFLQAFQTVLKEQWFILFILIIIALFPLMRVGLVTGDDFEAYLGSDRFLDYSYGCKWAVDRGRFYHIFAVQANLFAYIVDSQVYYDFMHIFPIFTSMFLFVWLIDQMFSDRRLTLLIALLICISYQITPWHSMTASHPFHFTFSLSLMIVAFHLLISYFKTNKYGYLLASAIIFAFVTLFYESYLMFYIVIFILIISRYSFKTIYLKKNIWFITKELLPFFLFGLLYLIAYFVFAHYHPSQYAGSSFAENLTFQDFFKCVKSMARHAYPPSTFFDYKEWIFPSQAEFFKKSPTSYFWTLWESDLVSWLKGLLVVYFYILLFITFKTKLSHKNLFKIFLMGLFITYLPQIPLGFSKQFTSITFYAWVPTFMSFFGVMLMFASVLFALNKLISFNEIFRKVINILILIPLFIATILVQEANTGITNDLKRSKLRIDAVYQLLENYEIKNGEVYYLNNLYNNTSTLAATAVPPGFWDSYFQMKKGVSVKAYEDYQMLLNDYSAADTMVNVVFLNQPMKENDIIISIVKCKGSELTQNINDLKSDRIDVGYYSPNKFFAVSILSDSTNVVTINDQPMKSYNSFHCSNISSNRRKPVSYFSIIGKKLMNNTIMVKNTCLPETDTINVAK